MLNPMSGAKLDKATAEQVSKGWWILLLSGLVSIVAGILILTIRWTVACCSGCSRSGSGW